MLFHRIGLRAILLILVCGTTAAPAADRYPAATFSDFHEGSLNISVFTFRDLNRNGKYDIGDLPLVGILVDRSTEGLPDRTRSSNGSGFANFEMSATNLTSDVPLDGAYTFSVAIPDGWHVTTGNAVQETRFFLLPGAPADMFADPPPLPVGLAPDLTISGSVEKGTTTLRATSPAGETLDVPLNGGRYTLPAGQGQWTLAFDGASGPVERTVNVEAEPVVVSEAGRALPSPSAVEVVDFESLVPAEITKVPSGYHGLDWQNVVAAYWKFYEAEGYRNALMSGAFVGYNGSGQPASVSSKTPFDFAGGYVGLGSLAAQGEQLRVLAWRGDDLAYQETITLSALGPVYFQADFSAVTRIEFRTAHYWQAIFDDLQFHLPAP
ncbi:MAG: hypothetical protein JNL14_15095 [Devosia sp.]|uniref:hypothetical protein n=1 Tax=Devosia sp. TaxID=1871048 RepID=UPI001A60CB5F|nr:hypothetical protein [Devosia sp.]MBL8599058.1 hypothetical protein [Devosia sp.]